MRTEINTPKISRYFSIGPSLLPVMVLATNQTREETSKDINQKKALKLGGREGKVTHKYRINKIK